LKLDVVESNRKKASLILTYNVRIRIPKKDFSANLTLALPVREFIIYSLTFV